MKSFYQAAMKYLLDKLPLTNRLLKSCSVLRPDSMRKSSSIKDILFLNQTLCPSVVIDGISDDWRLLMCDLILDDSSFTHDDTMRIDHYWCRIFQLNDANGGVKYPNITKTVKVALVLAHGNSDVERSFSESGNTVTAQRTSLSDDSVDAIRTTLDGIKMFKEPH